MNDTEHATKGTGRVERSVSPARPNALQHARPPHNDPYDDIRDEQRRRPRGANPRVGARQRPGSKLQPRPQARHSQPRSGEVTANPGSTDGGEAFGRERGRRRTGGRVVNTGGALTAGVPPSYGMKAGSGSGSTGRPRSAIGGGCGAGWARARSMVCSTTPATPGRSSSSGVSGLAGGSAGDDADAMVSVGAGAGSCTALSASSTRSQPPRTTAPIPIPTRTRPRSVAGSRIAVDQRATYGADLADVGSISLSISLSSTGRSIVRRAITGRIVQRIGNPRNTVVPQWRRIRSHHRIPRQIRIEVRKQVAPPRGLPAQCPRREPSRVDLEHHQPRPTPKV